MNESRSRLNELHYESSSLQRRIDNLLDAVADGTLDKEIVRDKLEKLRKDKESIGQEMARGQIIPFPRSNTSDTFLERFKEICKNTIFEGDSVRGRTFLKKFIDKITLTKDTCRVAYDLTGVIPITQLEQPSSEDCSSLRDSLVVPRGFEPLLPT